MDSRLVDLSFNTSEVIVPEARKAIYIEEIVLLGEQQNSDGLREDSGSLFQLAQNTANSLEDAVSEVQEENIQRIYLSIASG